MPIRINNTAAGDERTVIFLTRLSCVYTETCIRVASRLIRQMVVEERFLFLPFIRSWVLWCESCCVVALLYTSELGQLLIFLRLKGFWFV